MSAAPSEPPAADPADDSLFMLIFTSGTSGEPKAVRITHEKVTFPGEMLAGRFGLGADDVLYVSMPLFHSNAVMAGWGPALASGGAVALAEKFSASRLLDDVRRYGATYLNYVGKPLSYVMATPERPDDADNPLRIAFGNEAGDRDIEGFARRFGCVVVDGFGSTENAVIVTRAPGTPPGSIGMPLEGVAVLDRATGQECPRAVLDDSGQVTNLDEATGELVNTAGTGQFAGYYNDPGRHRRADARRHVLERRPRLPRRGGLRLLRRAHGGLAARRRRERRRGARRADPAAAPLDRPGSGVRRARSRCRATSSSRRSCWSGTLDPAEFEGFLDAQPDLGTKSRPRFVRLLDALPRTATNKVLKRELQADGIEGVPGAVWVREERGTSYS